MSLTRRARRALSLGKFLAETALHNGSYNPDSAVAAAFSCDSVCPPQEPGELLELARIVQAQRPRTILEIGSRSGGSLFVFCQMADPQAIVTSIDLPTGGFGGGYAAWRIPVMHQLKQGRQKLQLLRSDSHSSETLLRLRKILGAEGIQFLFIDGDHSYDGVRQDFEMYSPLVAPGGIIGFHDILEAPSALGGEVNRFWNEIKSRFRHREIVNDEGVLFGIGLLFV